MVTTEDLKNKFAQVQEQNRKLREEHIRLESEVKSYRADYEKKLKELLQSTGKGSYDEAVEFCKEKRRELDEETTRLNAELEGYLNPRKTGNNDDTDW